VLLVLEDLSEVRSLESQLLRAERLSTVGVLAAGVAHEMGTPLGVVRGRAEYLLGKVGASHPQASGLADIIDQIDQVTRTIRQLLDFSRVNPPSVERVLLHDAVGAVAALLRFELERQGLTLELDVDPALPPVLADPDQLQQVLVNLVKNACDACSPGGRVRIRAAVLPAGASPWSRVRVEAPATVTPAISCASPRIPASPRCSLRR
jgi:signal transduction histidine kinase